MMFFASIKTFSIAALILCAVSNATPLPEDSGLMARGNSGSKPTTCSIDDAIKAAAIKRLPGNALFFTGVGLPVVQRVAKANNKYEINDMFPAKTRDAIIDICTQEGGDGWAIMSQAMATVASGEVWVLKRTAGLSGAGKYFQLEMDVLRQNCDVTELWRVGDTGAKQERLQL